MDVTASVPGPVGWWTCADCGVEVELPAVETAGYRQDCPDCPGALHESWSWEPVSA